MTSNAISEIWYTRCPVPTPIGLAAQLGYLEETFRKDGVTLNSIIDSPDRDVCQSYFDHTLGWSFRHGANLPPIRVRSAYDPKALSISCATALKGLVSALSLNELAHTDVDIIEIGYFDTTTISTGG